MGEGGRTARVGLSARFELTWHFMLCFTEGLFVLHMKDLIKVILFTIGLYIYELICLTIGL